jgi:Branched-chain amino acid transport protein (AzlD)
VTKLLLEPYIALVLLGFLPSEIWRWLGIALGRGLDEESEIIQWVRAVATALVAGVVARIVLFPPGALAGVPLGVRLAAITCGFLAFLFIRRSPFAGVLTGEAVLIAGALAFGR